jgi:hypothetical protein
MKIWYYRRIKGEEEEEMRQKKKRIGQRGITEVGRGKV